MPTVTKPVVTKPSVTKPTTAAAKPTPSKPTPAAQPKATPAPAAKTNGASNGAATNGAAKPAPTKPAPSAAKSAPAAPTKPTTAAPSKPAAPATPDTSALEKRITALEEALAAATTTLTAQNRRIAILEVVASGYGNFASVDDDGNIVLDIDNADRDTLRNWCWQFGFPYEGETEQLRAQLKKARSAKDFAGWEPVNEGAAPEEAAAAPAEEEAEPEAEAEAESEEEEQEELDVDPDEVAKMNWTQLTELCDKIGVPYDDLSSKQPKVLRNRVLEALENQESEDEGEEAEASGEESDGELSEGAHVIVTHEGVEYPGTFQGYDDDGDCVVQWDGDGETVAVPVDMLRVA